MIANVRPKPKARSVKFLAPTVLFCLTIAISVAAAFAISDSYDDLLVFLPIIVTMGVAIVFYKTLWKRDGAFPLFDIGSVTLLAMLIYTIYPLFGMIASGFKFTVFSSLQFYQHQPTAQDIMAIAWRYVAYMIAFAITYLKMRKASIPQWFSCQRLRKSEIMAFVIIGVVLFIAFKSFQYLMGISLDKNYDEELIANYEALKALPLIVQQIVVKLYGAFFIIKLGIVLYLMSMWHNKRAKMILILALFSLLIDHIFSMRARTELVLVLLAVILLYNQFVRRLSLQRIGVIGVLMLVGFLGYGIVRGATTFGEGIERLLDLADPNVAFSSANEFQALYAGTYDLYRTLIQSNFPPTVSWNAYLYDLTLVIPSQLLPFEKWDPQLWYIDQYRFFPGYFMYNPICQSIVGFGWVELVLRGFLVGWLFAKLHNWYTHHAAEYWPTLFYLWMAVWSYYVIRSSISILFTNVIQVFIPAFIMVKVGSRVFSRV